jgi:pimeloyl-ACP methyl ester carboxylesterase
MRRVEFTRLVAASFGAATLAGYRAPIFADPISTATPGIGAASPGATPTYDGAVQSIRALIARDDADPTLEKVALPRLYEHGAQTTNAIVLLHGFTNCPQQFEQIGHEFYDRGFNVYIPRIPRHGKADRLTKDLLHLTVAELKDCSKESYDFARGLGKNVTVLGLSLGGTMAMWIAQTQPVDLAVPIAPFLQPIHISQGFGLSAMRFINTIPDFYMWWDPRAKANQKPVYGYPGYPTHALAQTIFLGNDIFAEAAKSKPLARNIVLETPSQRMAALRRKRERSRAHRARAAAPRHRRPLDVSRSRNARVSEARGARHRTIAGFVVPANIRVGRRTRRTRLRAARQNAAWCGLRDTGR